MRVVYIRTLVREARVVSNRVTERRSSVEPERSGVGIMVEATRTEEVASLESVFVYKYN